MPGQSDIIAVLPPHGRFIGIEVKTPTGRVSSDQILFKKRLESVGGMYIVARNVADIKDILTWG